MQWLVVTLMLRELPRPNFIGNKGVAEQMDASGGGVFLNLLDAAKGVLNRAAASTQTLCR